MFGVIVGASRLDREAQNAASATQMLKSWVNLIFLFWIHEFNYLGGYVHRSITVIKCMAWCSRGALGPEDTLPPRGSSRGEQL